MKWFKGTEKKIKIKSNNEGRRKLDEKGNGRKVAIKVLPLRLINLCFS